MKEFTKKLQPWEDRFKDQEANQVLDMMANEKPDLVKTVDRSFGDRNRTTISVKTRYWVRDGYLLSVSMSEVEFNDRVHDPDTIEDEADPFCTGTFKHFRAKDSSVTVSSDSINKLKRGRMTPFHIQEILTELGV